jgi:hypothetical protein
MAPARRRRRIGHVIPAWPSDLTGAVGSTQNTPSLTLLQFGGDVAQKRRGDSEGALPDGGRPQLPTGSLGGLLLVAALGELLDDLGAERRQVIGLAAGHEPVVHHDLLVDPLRSGVP